MPDTEPPDAPAAPLPAVRTLAVIGAGSMGHGIAQTAALAGITTILHDVDQAAVDRGLAGIEAGLARMVARAASAPTSATRPWPGCTARPTCRPSRTWTPSLRPRPSSWR